MSVAALSLYRWAWIRFLLLGGKVGMGLGWDDRLSMLYRTVILIVGRNARVQYHSGVMVMTIRRVLLLRDELGIHRWP